MAYEGTKLSKFDPIDRVDQLQIVDIEVGAGDEVQPGTTITAHYTGALCKTVSSFKAHTTLVNQSRLGSTKSFAAGPTACLV